MAINNVEHKQVVQPLSAPPSAPLSEEDKAKRFAELRERLKVSRIAVTLHPVGKYPYWARKNDEGELSRLEYMGFNIVHDDPKSPRWRTSGLQLDGTYVVGDVILMEIDEDLYEALQMLNAEKSAELVKSASDQFMAEAVKSQVPVFTRSK